MTCSTIPNARITTRCLPAHETPVLKSPGLAVAAMGGLPCGGTQFGITAGFLNVLRLRGHRADMVLVCIGLLLRCRTRFDPTRSTVVADVSFGDIHHRRYRSLTASIPFQNTLGGFDITCR
jgi:hypothetical protein